MPRRRNPAGVEAPVLPPPATINPTGVYLVQHVRSMFSLRKSSLRREIREGRLKVCKRCGRYFFLGSQLLDWLRDGELSSPARRHEMHGAAAN
jgi:hypothetical protein